MTQTLVRPYESLMHMYHPLLVNYCEKDFQRNIYTVSLNILNRINIVFRSVKHLTKCVQRLYLERKRDIQLFLN